jgi:hypothetical protein
VLCLATLLSFGCASSKPAKLDANLAGIWKEYRDLPDSRALAIAGNPRTDRWIAGLSGGHASADAAVESALRECRANRVRQLTPLECKLYAVGDEIVWPGP